MKNIIIKAVIGCAVVGAAGFAYWYYDFGAGIGAGLAGLGVVVSGSGGGGQIDDTAIVGMSGDDSSSGVVGAANAVNSVGVSSVPDGAGGSSGDLDVSGQAGAASDALNDAPVSSVGDGDVETSSMENVDENAAPSDAFAPSAQSSSSPSPAASIALQACSFSPPTGNLSHAVILNEIAWMGSLPEAGETSAKASNREWIELKNITTGVIDLSGWQILDSGGNLKIVVATSGTMTSTSEIPPGGFYLLVRDGQSLVSADGGSAVPADNGYAGGLSNAGDQLELFDANCGVSDFLDASAGWPAGSNTTKQTMERDAGGGLGWHTSVSPGGTPRAENSAPVAPPAPAVSSSTQSPPPPQYLISVSMTGNGSGVVSSSPSGILCGFDCESSYPAGTKLTFAAVPVEGSIFSKWSGTCADIAGGTGAQCSFTVSSSVSVVADFEQVPPLTTPPPDVAPQISQQSSSTASSSDSGDSGTPDTDSTSTSATSATHLLIAAVQIAGGSGGASSNDFVKIFNPTGASVDLSGWKLHKKSSTGADYSLKSFATGSTIAPGGYFVWANSTDGFADSIDADASSTETLSADNSVALFDANGNVVDQVAWGTGTNQYVEGAAYATDPTAGQVLVRVTSGGAMVDTDNNATDFAIQ